MKFVIIVEPYSSGGDLITVFRSRGFQCVALLLRPVPSMFQEQFESVSSELYDVIRTDFQNFDYNARSIKDHFDFSRVMNEIKKFNPVSIIAGSEYGVEFSDYVSSTLGKISNGFALSTSRRNKFNMQEVLKESKLSHISHALTYSTKMSLEIMHNGDFSYPVVIKPVHSTASNQVYFCNNDAEMMSSSDDIFSSKNIFGDYNSEAIIEDFISGDLFAVNSVSLNGFTLITDIFRYEIGSIKHINFFDFEFQFFNFDGVSDELICYNKKVLDVLGIKNGPAHAEIMLTSTGPVLVEVGARLYGERLPKFVEKIVQLSPLELTADCYVDSDAFFRKLEKGQKLLEYGVRYKLRSFEHGTVKEIRNTGVISRLISYENMSVNIKSGENVSIARKSQNSLGYIDLKNTDEKQLKADLVLLREIDDINPIICLDH